MIIHDKLEIQKTIKNKTILITMNIVLSNRTCAHIFLDKLINLSLTNEYIGLHYSFKLLLKILHVNASELLFNQISIYR